jgi:predicted phosphodiesterase
MAAKLSQQDAQRTLDAIASNRLRTEAAAELGISESALRERIRNIKAGIIDPHATSVYNAAPAIHKPRLSIPAATADADAQIYTVVAIGDHHDKPGRDKERALWLGRFAFETEPDFIVSIGDWASLDSLSSHEIPGSQTDVIRPSFAEELDSLNESLSKFHAGLPVGSIPIFQTHGNHEARAWRVANNNPKQSGDLCTRLDETFMQYRWITRPYGEFLTIADCDFVHIPSNTMGRDMGGEHVERNVAAKSLRSIVHGHTHKFNVYRCAKVGQNRAITVVNLGTSMPMGMVEPYTGVAMSGWSYGVVVLRICNGDILSVKHFDMTELEQKFAD